MGAAFYIVVETPDPGFETFVNGKALSRASKAIEAAALRAGVTPLMSFFSMAADDAAAFAEDLGLDAAEAPASEQWFSADDGLRTIGALLAAVASDPPGLGPGVREDLLEFQGVLRQAQERGIRWHLGVDY